MAEPIGSAIPALEQAGEGRARAQGGAEGADAPGSRREVGRDGLDGEGSASGRPGGASRRGDDARRRVGRHPGAVLPGRGLPVDDMRVDGRPGRARATGRTARPWGGTSASAAPPRRRRCPRPGASGAGGRGARRPRPAPSWWRMLWKSGCGSGVCTRPRIRTMIPRLRTTTMSSRPTPGHAGPRTRQRGGTGSGEDHRTLIIDAPARASSRVGLRRAESPAMSPGRPAHRRWAPGLGDRLRVGSGSDTRRSSGSHLIRRRPLAGKTRGMVERSSPTIGGKTARPSLQ